MTTNPQLIARMVASLLAVAIAGCATTRSDAGDAEKVKTSSDVSHESVEGAITSPLRDLNLLKTKIPEVLLQANADPYAKPAPATCEHLIELVKPLNDALGDDIDRQIAKKDGLLDNIPDKALNAGLGMVADTASDFIPYRSWVRKLTGAERHDNLVSAAIIAGTVRRSYLKGYGEALGCDAPATPLHKPDNGNVPHQP
jgi:hypothetical protein